MYALSEEHCASWAALYARIAPDLETLFGKNQPLKFETDFDAINCSQLLIGQTCGFPLVTRYKKILKPVCAAHFDVDGCSGAQYASVIVVAADSDINSLLHSRGRTAVINNHDSNSGMNVFRAKLTGQREAQGSFFSNTLVSGSHKQSLLAVADRKADIASIDCVSFAYLESIVPDVISKVKILEYSEQTMGLPFVVPRFREEVLTSSMVVDMLNSGLESLDCQHRDCLRIKEFSEVSINNYVPIADLNSLAIAAGHKVHQL